MQTVLLQSTLIFLSLKSYTQLDQIFYLSEVSSTWDIYASVQSSADFQATSSL